MSLHFIHATENRETDFWVNSNRAAYSHEEVFHSFQRVVERRQNFGRLDGAVRSMSQLFVALEH